MAKVPFSAQRTSSGRQPLQHIEDMLRGGGYLSGDQLARLVEAIAGQPLPPWLANYLARFLRGQVRRPKGRPPASKAALEISLWMADRLYYRLLPRYQREVRQRKAEEVSSRRRTAKDNGGDRASASELAYKEVLRRMRKDFPNIDWKALRNKLAEWRSGKFLHVHPDDGDEFVDAY